MEKRFIIIAAAIVFLSGTGCTDEFESINTDPTKIAFGALKPSNLFEPILFDTGTQSQYYSWFWNAELIQVTAFTGGSTRQEHLYQVTDGNAQSIWDNFARRAADANHMLKLAQEQEDSFFEAIALILKAYQMAELVSLFGDIPYTEAFQYSANRSPMFEPQEMVFSHILDDLEKANRILELKPTSGYASLDQMYGGDASAWRKFANSLKLRYLCRMTNISDGYWEQIASILSNPSNYPVFTKASDGAAVPYQGMDPYKSYWAKAETTKGVFQQHRLTQQIIKMTAELDTQGNALYADPRLIVWGVQTGGKWKGTVSGGNQSNRTKDDEGTSKPNFEVLASSTLPGWLMDYSEILFIEAEGVLKGKLSLGDQSARSLYEKALRENMQKWASHGAAISKPINSSDIDKYLASSLGSYDQAGTEGNLYGSKEEFLQSQKWLSLLWVGWEQYHEWRRTEYPVLTIGEGTVYNDHELPTRFVYPSYTVSSNKENVENALSRMGGNNDMHTALDWSYKKCTGSHRNPYTN